MPNMRLTVVTVCLIAFPTGTRAFIHGKPALVSARTRSTVVLKRPRTLMSAELAPHLLAHIQPILSHPQELVSFYKEMAEAHGLAVDALTCSVIYGASQTIATFASRMAPHLDQFARFVLFGSLDGAAGHYWYHMMNDLIAGRSMQEVGMKMAADATFYTPTYCLTFLALVTLAEGGGMQAVANRLQKDYKQMVMGTWMLMAPCNAVIYGAVPLEYQVLASCAVMFCYTVVLALWESSGHSCGGLHGSHGSSGEKSENAEKIGQLAEKAA